MSEILKRNKLPIFIAFTFTLLVNASYVGYAFVFQRVVDYIIELDAARAVLFIVVQISVFFLISLCRYLAVYFRGRYLQRTLADIKGKLFTNYMNTGYDDYHKRSCGDYLNALTTWVNETNSQFILPIYRGVSSVILSLGSLIAIFFLSPPMGGLAVVLLLGQVSIPYLRRKKTGMVSENYATETSRFAGVSADLINGFTHIASLNVFTNIYNKFHKANKELELRRFKMDTTVALSDCIIYFVRSILILVPWLFGIMLIVRGDMTFGEMMAISQLNNSLAEPLSDAISYFNHAIAGKEIAKKIDKDLVEFVTYSKKPFELEEPFKNIEAADVTFSYDNDSELLQGVSYKFDAGLKYALTGESGCGKSTFCKILGGMITSYSGQIKVNGRIVDAANDALSSIVTYCPQDTYLFDESIYNNVALFRSVTKDEVKSLLERLGLGEFIGSLPDGLDTMLGSAGIQLSGGQKQRLGLARVLICKNPVILLDEVTSSLDIDLYNEIEELILSLHGTTVIAVTHRPESDIIDKYDEQLVINKNCIG